MSLSDRAMLVKLTVSMWTAGDNSQSNKAIGLLGIKPEIVAPISKYL